MEPGEADELMHVLKSARDEAKKMMTARSERAGKKVVWAITNSTAVQ